MADYIEREALCYQLAKQATIDGQPRAIRRAAKIVADFPAADVVSRGAYDQTDWERCVALTQLKEIGKSLGERMDDVRPVVLCRDCEQYCGRPWENNETGICARTDCGVGEDDFCSYGEKQEES